MPAANATYATDVRVIGNAIEFNGEPIARITAKEGTARDRFIDLITNAENESTDLNEFIESLKKEAKLKAEAGAVTLDELADIIDKLTAE